MRESPRVVAASVLLAGLLVLIGILVASTTASGTKTPATPAPRLAAAVHPAGSSARQSAALSADQATIAQLRASLTSQAGQLASATTMLRAARANARCWHAKVLHPIKTRRLHCAPIA